MVPKLLNYLMIIAVVLALSLLIGCTAKQPTLSPEEVQKLTPTSLVETYYKSLAKGNYENAKLCLSFALLQEIEQAERSDFTNVKEVSKIIVKEVIDTKNYDNNFEEKMVVVDYQAVYKVDGNSSDGLQHRFVYVAKKNSDSPWKIISIGSGP